MAVQVTAKQHAPSEIIDRAAKALTTNVYSERNRYRPVVYFLLDRRGRVKIGRSSNLHSRVASLNSSLGESLEILRVVGGGAPTERWLHKRFSPLRIGGEWFIYDDEMLAVVPPDEISPEAKHRVVLATPSQRCFLEAAKFLGLTADESVREVLARVAAHCPSTGGDL